MNHNNNGDASQCPFLSGAQKKTAGGGTSNRDWWPNELKLNTLRQNGIKSNPMGEDFNYAEAFKSVDFTTLKQEVIDLLTEWSRVLKKNGTLRIAVPDFGTLTWLYRTNRMNLSQMLGPLYGKMKMGNETIYHKTTYDIDSLTDVLENAGFTSVRRYRWTETEHAEFDDHSQAYIPHMDKKNGFLISLNVENVKNV